MEKNSAACVMDWSIELEKALRSKKPGRALEAISEISPRLQRLSREPEPSPAVYHLFDLIPGEEKLFSNSIILRLAHAFECGDKHTRLCIAEAFLLEYRKRQKQKEYKGVLSKNWVLNQAELLGKVKVVYDNGDVEDRALALGLFGCWAHFAKESASIRYLVLSSLVSSHVLEVKASLFAAGCFAELAEDFACVLLEMLFRLMSSPETLPAARLAGARAFSKIRCSHSLASNAYKTCLELLSESPDEDYQVAMLVSLSKLAARSTTHMSQQVDLLLLFLSQEKTIRLRATAIRCLHFIFGKETCHVSVNLDLVKTLSSIVDEPKIPSPMLSEALHTLRKVILFMLPNLSSDVLESSKLLSIAENASLSPITTENLLALSILVYMSRKLKGCMSRKLKGSTEMGSLVRCSSFLPSQVISLIMDWITLTVKPVLDLCQTDSVVFQQVNSLLSLLFLFIREYPDFYISILDQISVLVKSLSDTPDTLFATAETDAFVSDNGHLKGEKRRVIRSKILFSVYRFLVAFLENLTEAGAVSTEVFNKMKLLVKLVCQRNLFECYIYTLYSLLLDCQIIWGSMANEREGSCELDRTSRVSLDKFPMEHEIHTIECAKRMLTEENNWSGYRVGMYAACQGAWLTASFIFEKLVLKVRSNSCCCWMKSLVLFAESERKIQLLVLSKQGLEKHKFHLTVSGSDFGEISRDASRNLKDDTVSTGLAAVYNSLCSSLETLKVDIKTCQTFYFQRWFLSVRAKVLRNVVELVEALGSIRFDQDKNQNLSQRQVDSVFMVENLISLQKITQLSFQLKKLAREFDLVTTSFIGMDRKSTKIISELAISCSLLAFCAGFALYIPSLTNHVSLGGLGMIENSLDAMLIQNLIARLGQSNHETTKNLCLLMEASRKPRDCFNLHLRIQACEIGLVAKDIQSVCSYAVSGIADLKSKGSGVHIVEDLSQVTEDGLLILYNILMKWLQTPFRTPKYFFKLRPCLGSELFAVNENRNPDRICVSSGFHLSLNLCLQLRNMPPDVPGRLKSLYCMLYCKLSFQVPEKYAPNKRQPQGSYQVWEADDMVEMYEKLLQYVKDRRIKKSNKRRRGDNDGEFVKSFVHFELNEKGQGFSSCLLYVSAFPVGSYKIRWLSCCVDSQGNCWTLPSLNSGPVFTVQSS